MGETMKSAKRRASRPMSAKATSSSRAALEKRGKHSLRDGYDEKAEGKLDETIRIVEHRDSPILQKGSEDAVYDGVKLVQGKPSGIWEKQANLRQSSGSLPGMAGISTKPLPAHHAHCRPI
jgi:hypothetical protein